MSGFEQDFEILERVTSRVAGSSAPRISSTNVPTNAPSRPHRVWSIPGVYAGTRLSTNFGEVPAHLIRVRDKLRTREDGFLPVLRIDEYKLDPEFLDDHPEARPLMFSPAPSEKSGSDRKVYVSPAQKILARNADGKESLRRASRLTSEPGVLPNMPGPFTYYVFHLGKAALVRAEGMWVAMSE